MTNMLQLLLNHIRIPLRWRKLCLIACALYIYYTNKIHKLNKLISHHELIIISDIIDMALLNADKLPTYRNHKSNIPRTELIKTLKGMKFYVKQPNVDNKMFWNYYELHKYQLDTNTRKKIKDSFWDNY
jgi:hypothetical protein